MPVRMKDVFKKSSFSLTGGNWIGVISYISILSGTTTSGTIYTNNVESNIGNVGNDDAFIQLYTNNELTWTRRLGGTGKDTFIKKYYPNYKVISLDNIRRE